MRLSLVSLSIAVILALTSAIAAAQGGVRVFDAAELTLDRYTVIKRIWADTWRASFWVPTHDDAASAISALTSKAADLGADGVVNLHCVNDQGGWGSGYFCYGLAIKLK